MPLRRFNLALSKYLADRQGSVRKIVDGTGTVKNSYAYDAYGNTMSSSETVGNPFRYTGQYRDSETGCYYLRARYYDPSTHQFLTVDPLLAVTGDAYNYAGGSPTNATDPRGLEAKGPCIGGGWLAGWLGPTGSLCLVTTTKDKWGIIYSDGVRGGIPNPFGVGLGVGQMHSFAANSITDLQGLYIGTGASAGDWVEPFGFDG